MTIRSRSIPVLSLSAVPVLLVLLSVFTLGQGSKVTSETAPLADSDQDNPAARERWFMKGRTAPAGQSAAELRHRAHQQKLQMRMRQLTESAAAPMGAGPTTPSSGWQALGPAPLASNAGTGQDYGLVSGRVNAVAIDPADSSGNTVYVGGAYGGLWRSTNAASGSFGNASGITWTPLTDDQPTLSFGAIAIQPGNSISNLSNVIVLGTGEANAAIDSYYGLGFLRSADAGHSWQLISSDTGGRSFMGLAVSRMAFNSMGTLLVAAVAGSPLGAETGAIGSNATRGLYTSLDAGVTWTYHQPGDPGGPIDATSATSVVYNAGAGKFYAAIRFHGFYSSSDGITWTRLAQQPGSGLSTTNCPPSPFSTACPMYRGEIAVVPGRKEMYVWFVDGNINDQGVWRSLDGGSNWTQINASGLSNCGDPQSAGCGAQQAFFNMTLAAVPNGSATDLYAGAVNEFKCPALTTSSTSCTGGSWLNLTHVYGCSPPGSIAHVHPDEHAVDFTIVGSKDLMYFGNDGGIYRALDGFTGLATGTCGGRNQFDSLNATIGSLSQFVSISQDPSNSAVILGGTQDNGSPATNQAANSTSWVNVNAGDGGYNEINPNNTTEWFTANTDVSIQRCTGGINCNALTFNQVVGNAQVGGDFGPFYTPYILDPRSSGEMIVGTCRVWRGTSQGANFLPLSNDFDTASQTACTGQEVNQVHSIAAGGPLDGGGFSSVIYAGTDGFGPPPPGSPASPSGGRLLVTTNAAGGPALWQDLTPSAVAAFEYTVSSIAVDPSDASGQTAYITIMGFGGPHVLKTTNVGQTWMDFSGSIPDAPANSVVLDPGPTPVSGTLYVGTDVGVFSSPTVNANWIEVGPAPGPATSGFLPNVPVTRLRVFNSGGQKQLRASTYGRGVWQFALSTAADYAISFNNLQLSAFSSQTQTATYTGTLYALFGYNSGVSLSCGGAAPPTCITPPTSLIPTPGGTSFSVNVGSSAFATDYNFTIHAVGADASAITHDFPLAFHVFSLDPPGPPSVIANQGSESQPTSIGITAGQATATVNFSCDPTSVPLGATCYFMPPALSFSGGVNSGTTAFTLGTTSSTPLTPVGMPYNVKVQATTSGPQSSQTTTVAVTVQMAKDYNLALGTPASMMPLGSSSFPVTLTPVDGYSGNVSLNCFASSTVTCTFSPSSVTVANGQPATATATVQASSGTQVGTYSVNVFATDQSGLSHSLGTPVSVTDFQFVPNVGVASVTAGQTASFSLKINPLGGSFANSISLACASGLPTSTNCSFTPASITPGASPATVTLNISTAAATASLGYHLGKALYAMWLPLSALVLVCGHPRTAPRRQKRVFLIALLLVMLFSILLIGCGGGSSSNSAPPPPPPPSPGTPAGTYTVVISATSGPLPHTTSVSLIVH